MHVFDRVDRSELDRRELQLLVLAVISICMLGAGIALLAYPTIFTASAMLTGPSLKICFFAFCGMCILLVGYLLDRHFVVRKLRQQIEMERRQYAEFRFQAGRDLLSALPRFNQFQDRLVMEYRRASNLSGSFSVLVIKLTPAINSTDEDEISAAFGDAVKAVSHRLRREDSLYRFCADAFGIILPGLKYDDAKNITGRLEEGLRDAAGASNRFSSVLKVFTYPQQVSTAHEMESAVRSILPADMVSEPVVDQGVPAIAEN